MKIRPFLGTVLISIVVLVQEPLLGQVTNEFAPYKAHCALQKEEVEVFASYLKENVLPHDITVVVTETMPTDVDVDTFNLQLAVKGRGIPPEIRQDFKKKNRTTCVIEPFADIKNLRFISKIEHDQIFRAGWSEFHKMYGKDATIVWLSRVGSIPRRLSHFSKCQAGWVGWLVVEPCICLNARKASGS
jgi:hypothetical protein